MLQLDIISLLTLHFQNVNPHEEEERSAMERLEKMVNDLTNQVTVLRHQVARLTEENVQLKQENLELKAEILALKQTNGGKSE